MSESVEQAATIEGWKARAEREASVILAQTSYDRELTVRPATYPTLVSLLAIAWLQGANFGAHDTLGRFDQAFDRLRESL